MKIAFIGQPNCGKSTIFNYFSGYKAAVSNFPGTTVKYTVSQVVFEGEQITCVDLPGVYSLTSTDQAELNSRNYLLSGEADVIVNVIDASLLGRSLELTLELMSLERPLVVALNMMDEAARKGTVIDAGKLSELLGVPVVTCVAAVGRGLTELLQTAIQAGHSGVQPVQMLFSADVEQEIAELSNHLDENRACELGLPHRFMLVKLLEDDPYLLEEAGRRHPDCVALVRHRQKILAESHGRPPETVISSERHALSVNVFEQVAVVRPAGKPDWRKRLDHIATHKFWGYVLLVLILGLFFQAVFRVGQNLENFLTSYLDLAQKAGPGLAGKPDPGLHPDRRPAHGHLRRGGHRAALPVAVSHRPGRPGGQRLSAPGGLPDGQPDAPFGPARQVHHPLHPGLRLQRALGDVHPHPGEPPGPPGGGHAGHPHPLFGPLGDHLRPGGLRPGAVLGPGGLFLQPAGHRPPGSAVHLHSAGGLAGAADGDSRVPPADLEKRGSQVLAQPEGIHRHRLAHPHRGQPGPEPAEILRL